MPNTSDKGLLEALNILVVEDDFLQAEEICLCVTDAGGIILGPTGDAKEAVALIDLNGVDVAIVDINLGDGPSFEVAGYLLGLKLPFLFVTGYDCRSLPTEFLHVMCLGKPYTDDHLVRCLADAFSNRSAA